MEHTARGSVWRKWDFHIHTPYSILNNQYGCNPNDEASFDEYVKTLFTKAVEKGIAAIGITDYFSIEGYRRIRTQYLDDPDKMQALFPEPEIREKIGEIYVFPNVEFRLDTFVGGGHSINYHVIFSDEVSILDIEENFLQCLKITFHAGSPLSLTKNNIEKVGRDYKQSNSCGGADYKVGLERITVKYEDILNVLKQDVFADKYIITIPVDEDLSTVDWTGRDYLTRKVLYQQCHCLLTSNANTRKWALAKGHEEEQKLEFGSIKPCIWGSDAHSYDRMFEPDENRFCWIKAEPSFAGLRQILYEPEDRVRIQANIPDTRNLHQTIDYIVFDDKRFQTDPIFFSEWLTCIIGGKSTGKSILLRHVAKGISPSTVARQESKMRGSGSRLDVKAKVIWKDGTSGERKILYIPQSWLNQAVDEIQSDSPLNKMIEDILIQNDTIGPAYYRLRSEIEEILGKTRQCIIDYVGFLKKANDCEEMLQQEGRPASFKATIEQLENQRANLTASAGITPEAVARYTELEAEKSALLEKHNAAVKEQHYLSMLRPPVAYIPNITGINYDGSATYNFDNMPIAKNVLNSITSKINETIYELWTGEYQKAESVYSELLLKLQEREQELLAEYNPLKELVAINDQLIQIDYSLQEERQKLSAASERERTKQEALSRAEEQKALILHSQRELRDAYRKYKEIVESVNSENTDLQFNAEIAVKSKDLLEVINSTFDNRGFRRFQAEYGYDLSSAEGLKVEDELYEKLWIAMTAGIDKLGALLFKGGNSLQSALENIFRDWNFVHYIVKSGNDTISNMSPGKKALVLLEMLINLENGNCPILIDQPEDDLDNRSIYSELVRYLRQKKHERQIIVVTHNANVVVGADAEEVIIANQDGKDTENCAYQFEYRSGAIENNDPVIENGIQVDGVLNQKGIQEQICDILEGGRQAFEARRKKYSTAAQA